ncbi:MAG: hypothetical protein O3C15_04460, partial [Proteobacteria bacterium]|nr:hypothetical protein [Pseudomonadota bacterium]
IDKGFVKAGNFRASSNKAAYLYLLTPAGLYEKSRLTQAFVWRKLEEYERLKAEISRLGELGLLPSEGARRVSRQDHSPPLEDRESMSPDIEISRALSRFFVCILFGLRLNKKPSKLVQ